MSTGSAIEWTEATWNPVTGCQYVSEGCRNCYAAAMTHRLAEMGQAKYAGLLNQAGHFNGKVRTHADTLAIPLKWRKPRLIFVNSMSDLFHSDVPFAFIDQVFAVMALCPQHTFQVLTKRPERMTEYMMGVMGDGPTLRWGRFDPTVGWGHDGPPYPLPNVWHGTSCENQDAANERIPHLLKCPAAVRFLSCEPLLGPVDLCEVPHPWRAKGADWVRLDVFARYGIGSTGIHWVICGGESGPKRRPMDLAWARSLRDQCKHAGVPFFMKQVDKKIPIPDDLLVREWPEKSHAA